MTFSLRPEARWRGWSDGCVVYSPRGAQTCLLPADCIAMLRSLESGPRNFGSPAVLPEGADAIIAHLVRIGAVEQTE